MTKLSLIVTLAAAVAVSCGPRSSSEEPPDVSDPEFTQSEDPDPVMPRSKECVNADVGYAIRYPDDWHENTGEIVRPCSLFDPEPIDVPRNSELPIEIAVMIAFEPVSFTTLTGDELGRRVLSRERTTVAGRQAMKIQVESTGEGLYDRGIRSYQYFVDLGDTTMIATTYDAGRIPFERKRTILDAMLKTIRFQ